MHLYEISATLLEIMKNLESAESESAREALKNALDDWAGDFEEKLLSVVGMAETLELEAAALVQISERKAKMAKSLLSRSKWLKNYALVWMKAVGKSEIKTPELSIKIKTGTGAVYVVDENKLGKEFFRTVPERKEIDKSAIRNVLLTKKKNGDEPVMDGARLVFNETLEVE